MRNPVQPLTARDDSRPASRGVAVLKVIALTIFTMVVGGRTIPWLLTHVSRTQSRELFTLAVLVTALGIAVSSAEVFGVSMALGACLAGLVVGRSEFSVRAASDALPMRAAFAVLFFVSVGMLLDPGVLLASPAMMAATLSVILIGKPLAALAIVALFKYTLKVGRSVAVALAQIGEFSFIVATLANQLGVLTLEATNTLVGADIVVSGEGEVALAFTAAVLERLGATPEQIDRERTRVRAELD